MVLASIVNIIFGGLQMSLKYRKKITTSIKNELVDNLNTLSEKTRIDKSKLFDEALEMLFKKYNDILENQS